VGSGGLKLGLAPMLNFISRSPDGCSTLLARPADRIGPPRKLVAVETTAHHLHAAYLAGDEPSVLDVRAGDSENLQIEAMTELPHTVWSQLNTFTELTIVGHRRLFVVFSPAPDVRIEFEPMDDPFGRPAQFAYLDAAGTFHVAQANDAEKGPFTDLASGPLAPGEPVTLRCKSTFGLTVGTWIRDHAVVVPFGAAAPSRPPFLEPVLHSLLGGPAGQGRGVERQEPPPPRLIALRGRGHAASASSRERAASTT
jgi:hypothetical protein